MDGEKKEPRHQVIAGPADILPALTRLPLWGCSSAEPHSVSPGMAQYSRLA